MLRIMTAVFFATLPAVAVAQQQAPTAEAPAARCLIAGKSFSAGATVRAASGVMLCGTDGVWTASDKPASGCFLADNFYSTGGIAGVSGSKTVSTCGPDGTWSSAPAAN